MKPQMVLQWHGESPVPISRDSAAKNIRTNRRRQKEHPARGIRVFREGGETYIIDHLFGVGCCIGRAR